MSSNGILDAQRLPFMENIAKTTSQHKSTGEEAKFAKMGIHRIRVYFSVKVNLVRPWEKMFVCGNVCKLGEWEPEKALEMDKDEAENSISGQSSSSIWRSSIELDCEECQKMLKFRYFIGYRLQLDPLDAKSPKFLGISRWEAKTSPRCILPFVEMNFLGECNREVVNEFGTYGGKHCCILDGWLNCRQQHQIMLRLSGPALKFFDAKLSQRQFLVRVTPCDVRLNQEFNFANSRGPLSWRTPSLYIRSIDEDSNEGSQTTMEDNEPPLPSFSCTEFANLLDDDRPFFRDQSPNGELYRNDESEYFVFRTTSVATEFLAFRIELFMMPLRKMAGDSKINLSPSRFALAYCMAASMPDTFGTLSLPLVAVKMQKPVGQIQIDYLLAKAMEIPPNLEITFALHWKKRRTLEVGHRGSGESFTKFASARENTIHSLNNAAQKGADFVEFDVQLSKDNSVVVFHDFHVLVSVAKRHQMLLPPSSQEFAHKSSSEADMTEIEALAKSDLHQMAVRDLTLDQLRLLHIHHYKAKDLPESGLQPLTGDPNESPELRPFPTLVETLQRVDPHTGFNVELKYPMKLKDGSHECENYFERNQYVDQVLADVFKHSGNRRIVFSSFDPDICTLLALKQNRFPVLFLCVGETTRYIPFLDERSNLSRIGTNFAACQKLLGVNLHSEELLLDPSPLKRTNALNLVVFVWGEDLANPKHVEYFRRQSVNAIIYDRIGEIEARQNVFIIEREAKNSLFKSPRSSPSPSPSRMNSLQKMNLHNEDSISSLSNGMTKQLTLGGTNSPKEL